MEHRYKVILSSKTIYKEIQINPTDVDVKVGTGIDCQIRLHKNLFFEPLELKFYKKQDGWSVSCLDNVYFSVGDVRKLVTVDLKHGDVIRVKYNNYDNEVFTLEFKIDFNSGGKSYERAIDIRSLSQLQIGSGPSNHIVIHSQYVPIDNIILYKTGNDYTLSILQSQYGVYCNGNLACNNQVIYNGDFISIGDFVFYIKDDVLWGEIRDDMILQSVPYRDYPKRKNYPIFTRNTRVKSIVNEEKIEVLDPPNKVEKPKNNLIARLIPSLGMLAAAGIMAFMGGMMIVFSLVSATIAIGTTIYNVIQNGKEFKLKTQERIDKYHAYINRKHEEIQRCRQEELNTLEETYISQSRELMLLERFSSNLFDRAPEDEDFLYVRLGTGNIESKRTVEYKKQEKLEVEDDLQQIPAFLKQQYQYLMGAPVICKFTDLNAVGIISARENQYNFFVNIVFDICARHYYSDVNMYFIAEEQHKSEIQRLRFLPYVFNEETKIRNIVTDDESKNFIYEYLYKELTVRSENKNGSDGRKRLLIFFYDDYGFKNHPISKFVDSADKLGVTFIFFGEKKADIPLGCNYLIEVLSNVQGRLIEVENKSNVVDFQYSTLSDETINKIVEVLAPVYTEEVSLEGTLTKNISLFQLLNILSVDDINLIENWKKSKSYQSMAAPLGVTKNGVVNLDLSDKAHGPHGLVAGTTGSGKSEILQTYILSMATLFHPYEVGFVIIDFKGGGMVNQFKALPHLLGAITNIDGKEIDRSLKSIKAELQKRQQLFADAEVNHIDKYIMKYKAGEVKQALPHLIVIVDEFAELKAEQPEFMKELISAARIGRSLGVHLILATQKPSGQVNEQIWSNSRFKLCLKVQSQEDSNEVLKSPLAAEIKEPGRAYLQVGNNEIFELFQSAYSGAPEKVEETNVKEFVIKCLDDSARKTVIFAQKKEKGAGQELTQLDAMVNYISKISQQNQIVKLPDICLPSLGQVISASTIETAYSMNNIPVGIYDDPEAQYQGIYSVDLLTQNVLIIGSMQSGKTNLLQTIIRNITSSYSAEDVNLYIVDFASMVLKNFETLNQVGGVVVPAEDEKLKNLFKMLQEEIVIRKEKLMNLGVSSYTAYKEAGETELPHIVVIIDNLTVLRELYFQDDEELLNLCRESLTVGITLIVANAQMAGIGYKYQANFACKIALFCNDATEYNNVFTSCRERIEDIHGRCIVEIDKRYLECQSYLAFEGEREINRVASIKEFIEENNSKNSSVARMIPIIPEVFTATYVKTQFERYMGRNKDMVLGFDYDTVNPYIINLEELGVVGIAGRESSGKHNFLKYIVNMLEQIYPSQSKVYVLDGITKKLATLKEQHNVVKYEISPDGVVDMIIEMEQQLKIRYEKLLLDTVEESSQELLVLVVDNMDAIQAICDNKEALEAYKNITTRYRRMKVCIIVSCMENATVPYAAPEILKNIRDNKHLFYFDDMKNLKVFDPSLTMIRQYKKPIELGDCYYMKETECMKLKTPICL